MTSDICRKPPETPFGVRLRAARKMAGMSMEDLAGKLGGRITKQAISKYETGRMMPAPEVLERLVEVLKVATWGASPLNTGDAGTLPRQLPMADTSLPDGEAPPMSRTVLRRKGLLRRILKGKDEAQRDILREASPSAGDRAETVHLCSAVGFERDRDGIELPVSSIDSRRDLVGELGEEPGSIAARRARYLAAWHSDAAVNEIRFRAGEKLAAKTESALKYRIADHLQRYLELESVLGHPARFENPVGDLPTRTGEEVEAAAAAVRGRWELGSGPVVNLLGLLEDRGVKVYEARGIEGFEGLSGRFGVRPFIAVSLDFPADRVRFTAAHELGHVLCDLSGQESPEGRCHAFGAAFLLPRSVLERAFAGPGRKVTLGELGEIKEAYGVSLQAIMHRAHALGLVTARQLRAFRETIKARGWVVEEPVAYAGRERATRFRRLLRYAVAEGIMDAARAAELGGVAVEELEKDIGEIF